MMEKFHNSSVQNEDPKIFTKQFIVFNYEVMLDLTSDEKESFYASLLNDNFQNNLMDTSLQEIIMQFPEGYLSILGIQIQLKRSLIEGVNDRTEKIAAMLVQNYQWDP